MSTYGTKLAEIFSAKLLKHFYEQSITNDLVNRDYEGEIKGKASIVNIPSLARLGWNDYDGENMIADDLEETVAQLKTSWKKSYYFKKKTITELESFIKDPEKKTIPQLGSELKKLVDTYLLGFWGKVAAGQRVGTDYATGTIAIDASGNVTGTSTVFTSEMIGKPFKATGHTMWYRVKTFIDTTHIVVEKDIDDEDASYDGGVISAGAAYIIQAVSKINVTKATLLFKIAQLGKILDEAEVPDEGRCIFVPPAFSMYIPLADGVNVAVPKHYEALTKRGFITELGGFKIFKTNRVSGDNVNGFHILATHPKWLTFAEAMSESKVEDDIIGNFGSAYKGLFVAGAKVADERRKFAAELFCTVSDS